MVKNKIKVLILAIFLFCYSSPIFTQTNSHQRLGVESKDSLDLTLGLGMYITRSDSAHGAGIEIDPSLTVDLLFLRRFGLSLELPYVAWAATERDVASRVIGAIGDPSIAATYTFRADDWRLGAELSYAHPLGIWNSYETVEKGIATGSGYPRLGACVSAIRYLDPIVAGVRLRAETGLARHETFGDATKPLILTTSLFATEALNDVVALSVGLAHKFSWPRCLNDVPDETGLVYSLSGNASLIFTEKASSLHIGISKLLSDFTSPMTFNVGYTYTFKKKEKNNAY